MNKKLIYSLCAATLLVTSCDYNEDNFPGFDNNPVTDVVYYEGEYTGKYPAEGYFSLTQGDEETGKAVIETALVSLLETTYPYCDKGSSAKLTVKVATIVPGLVETELADSYELQSADYDAMGTEKDEPGQYDNFSYKMDVNAYLTVFCKSKYPNAADGDVVKITYQYYSNYVTSTLSKLYKKSAGEWAEFINFAPSITYTLVDEDYDSMGTGDGEPGKYNNFDSKISAEKITFYLTTFAKVKFPYVEKGNTIELTYKYYTEDKKTENRTVLYQYNGTEWVAYDPEEPIIEIADRITVMKYDGTSWKLTNLISGVIRQKMESEGYTALVAWVKENKPAFMSDQKDNEEYYFGASAGYNNINNNYSTWSKYYNVDGYLTGLDNDAIQAIMDQRIAEGISGIVLPLMVTDPDPDMSYEITYNVYAGRGKGDYAMSFYYNAEEDKYEWDELTPVLK